MLTPKVIPEGSRFRTIWDWLTIILVLFSCVLGPYIAAFQTQSGIKILVLLYLADLFFILDILISCVVSYREAGVEIVDPKRTTTAYLRGYFTVDLIANFPIELVALLFCPQTAAIKILALWRVNRLLRIVKLFVIFKRWENKSWTNSAFLRISKLVLTAAIIIHLIACTWFFTAEIDGFPKGSWAEREQIVSVDPATQYIRSLYWAITTLTTVGFGDITPNRNIEYIVTMIVMLLGASGYAFIIGTVASLVSNLDLAKVQFWSRIDTVNSYLRARGVPNEVNDGIRHYYEYLWDRYHGFREKELFSDLPPAARLEVLLHLAKELLSKVSFFKHSSAVLTNQLLLALQPEIYSPGGYVVRAGEAGGDIYFITKGELEILSEDGETSHGTLSSGEYFGELSLILGERRTASVRARTYTDLFVLRRADFERIRSEYPEFAEVMKKVAAERSEKVSELMIDGIFL